MNGYTVIGSDPLLVRVFGATLGELFENAAFAVFDQGYVLESIPGSYSRPIVAAGDTLAELLANWIDELLIMSQAAQIAPSFFVVDRLEEGGVQGSAAGMPLDGIARRGPAVTGLARPPSDPIAVPEGWWVDIELVSGLGLQPA